MLLADRVVRTDVSDVTLKVAPVLLAVRLERALVDLGEQRATDAFVEKWWIAILQGTHAADIVTAVTALDRAAIVHRVQLKFLPIALVTSDVNTA
jgi:hypothetical protein